MPIFDITTRVSYIRKADSTVLTSDYVNAEWFIGHSGSTYWTKKDSEKAEIFRKIEPYLTFLNIPQLERQGADLQSKVEELEALNQSMRDRQGIQVALIKITNLSFR